MESGTGCGPRHAPVAGRTRAADGGTGTVSGGTGPAPGIRHDQGEGDPGRGAPVPVPPSHHGYAPSSQWPLRTAISLGALPGAVPCARLHVRQILWEWWLADPDGAAEVVISELATNAVQASEVLPGRPAIGLWLMSDRATVLALVADGSHLPPLRVESPADALRGRGLWLVESLALRWGWYPVAGPGDGYHPRIHKIVWAELATTPWQRAPR